MKNKRLIVYLGINILVSALTTLGVLMLWDFFHQSPIVVIPVSLMSTPTPTDTIQSTLPPSDTSLLQIDNVFGAGRLDSEMVVVKRIGEGDLWLTGWKMVDEQNHPYIFPRLLLNKGSVNIYTRAGIDTPRDLHWGQAKAMWQTGKKVRILDPLGNLRAEYIIP
jgi:hypothetical protein